MNAKLLQILISTAGPRFARILVKALADVIEELVENTETNLDDKVWQAVKNALSIAEQENTDPGS